jgi:nucleoside-diphosphate-sugar epimerase
MNNLFCFGFGYTAGYLARALPAGWQVAGTVRHEDGRANTHLFGDTIDFSVITHLLLSIPPEEAGDPALLRYHAALRAAPALRWIGYLSTTGVYGDHAGGLVDESTPLVPTSDRAGRRARAEQAWLDFGAETRITVQVFRLAGIYGPGRNVLDDIRSGTARRIVRPGQLFSRIHVEDIARVLMAAMTGESRAPIFNVCDDEPAAPAEVIAYGCELLGLDPPPEIPFERAQMSPMALTFWRDNKRVDNALMKRELGIALRYPTYREGLTALAREITRPSAEP